MKNASMNHKSLEMDESKIKNEFSCRALNCILYYVEDVYGTPALEEMVEKSGISLSYLRDQNNWVSWSYYVELLETLVEYTGDKTAPFKAGTYSGHKKSWGYLYYIFFAFGNVGMVLKKGVEIVHHWNKGTEWEMIRLEKNRASFRVRMREGFPAKQVACDCRLGQAAGISKAFGMPLGKARETQCQALGADSCICEVSWLNRPQKLYGIVGVVLAILLILTMRFAVPGNIIGFVESFFILLTGYLGGSILDYRLTQEGNERINQEQTDALEESVNVIESKYLELKRAHDGLFAMHEISRAVTSTLRLDDVLSISLQMIVEKLGFDRSIILLVDDTGSFLRHGRIHGDDSLTDFFSTLKVPMDLNSPMADAVLHKREGRIVTSDFIEGDEATELEKNIFEITKTREYVIAPLVSKDRLLGIMAADKKRSGNKIINDDKELMGSLANQVAMAIENARSFQMIEDLNVNLEKKVSKRTEELERSLRELKEAQEQLIHTEKMSSLGLLCSGLTHEINNPVNFAYNGITALRKSIQEIHFLSRQCMESGGAVAPDEYDDIQTKLLETTHEADRLMEIIDSGLNRTRNLVLDLKHFSRKGLKDPEFLVLRNPIKTALTILNHELSGRITVHEDFRFSEHIQGFPDQLNQVFLNIFLNSIQAIADKGNIWVRTEPAGQNEVRIVIRDDGIGIRKEHLTRVFEPFFTTKRSGQGTGLGMSICRRIIDHHGGKIGIESEEGVGTKVIITLPVRFNRSVKNGGCL